MATAAEINFVVDAIVNAGFTPETWPAFVLRSKLETEKEALESEARNMQLAEDAQNAEYSDAVVAKNEAIAAKQAEIDAL